jgi:hypothetical protein
MTNRRRDMEHQVGIACRMTTMGEEGFDEARKRSRSLVHKSMEERQ